MASQAGDHRRGLTDRGMQALAAAVLAVAHAHDPLVATSTPVPVLPGDRGSRTSWSRRFDLLLAAAHADTASAGRTDGGPDGGGQGLDDVDLAGDDPDRRRVVGLVRLAQEGDAEAFGQLYDRYVDGVYRFCYHRVSSPQLAEDLTSETFFRALRGIGSFRWQGRDFGAWLTTIARNLVTDHYKSSRARLEMVSDEVPERDDTGPGPEAEAMAHLTHEELARAMQQLPDEQRDCVVMRFLQGLSIAEVAEVLGRSDGAVKQLQLRAVRNLAKWLPKDLR